MRFLLRRAGFYLVALWASVTFNFILPRLMPGNPALAYLAKIHSQNVTTAQYNAMLQEFGVNPNVPIFKQYFDYIGALLHGQLGISVSQFPSQVSNYPGTKFTLDAGIGGHCRHSELSHRHPGWYVYCLEAWLLVRYLYTSNPDVFLRQSLISGWPWR